VHGCTAGRVVGLRLGPPHFDGRPGQPVLAPPVLAPPVLAPPALATTALGTTALTAVTVASAEI
jgi:hypothetical protein